MLDKKLLRFSAAMSSAAIMTGVLCFFGYWLGQKLDASLSTAPLFLIVFLIAGFTLGIWYTVLVFKRTNPT